MRCENEREPDRRRNLILPRHVSDGKSDVRSVGLQVNNDPRQCESLGRQEQKDAYRDQGRSSDVFVCVKSEGWVVRERER